MDETAVRQYVDRSLSIVDASPQMDEENTKTKLVNPFIELLGWDLYSTEVELEYTVDIATGTRKVDYALFVDGVPRVVVEAKGCDTDVAEATDQVRDYMRQELPVKWGIGTNGKTIQVLRKSERSESEEILFGTYELADLKERPGILDIFSKETIISGEDDEPVRRLLQIRSAMDDLQRQKETLAEEISELVIDHVDDARMASVDDEAKVFVDSLVSRLESLERDVVGRTGGGSDDAIVGTISREQLEGPDDADVAVFPARPSGVKFLRENNAWGFVKVGRTPDFVAMYVSDDPSAIRYIAEVDRVVGATEADLVKPAEEYTEEASFDPEDSVIVFKPGTLYELEDPIPFKEKYPQSLRYTTLEKIRNATTTKDVL